MRHISTLLICLLAAATGPAADLTIEVVLDCSASMNKSLADQRTRLGAAVDVVAALAAALPSDGSVHLGIRTVGGGASLVDALGCRDSSLVLPPAELDRQAVATAVGALTAGGPSPIALALDAVAEDLAGVDGPTMMILITDGLDSCGGDLESSIVGLKSSLPDLKIQVAGIALSPAALTVYSDLVPTADPMSTSELVAAVAKTVAPVVPLDTGPRSVAIDVTWTVEPTGGIASAELRSALSGATRPLTVTGTRLEGEAPGGFYNLDIVSEEGNHPLTRVFLDGEDVVGLTVDPRSIATVIPTVDRVVGGTTLEVDVHAAPRDAWITIVAKDAPPHQVMTRVAVAEGDSTTRLSTLPVPGMREIRLHRQLTGPASEFVAAGSVVALPSDNWVEAWAADDEVETGDHLEVFWDGPGGPDDVITIVPADSDPETVGPSVHAVDGAVLDLWAPDAGCAYEVRYVTQQAAIVADRFPLLVIQPEAGLSAPAAVGAGQPVRIRWFGPGDDLDFITIVEPEAADHEYRVWQTLTDGSPLTLTAPAGPGSWEIRYVSGVDNRVLDRKPLEVEVVLVSLASPPRVSAGTRFEVGWSGPGARGDYLTVAPRGSGPRANIDFAPTSLGTPASLAAPFKSGAFEVRYVSGASGDILASVPLQVE